MRRARLGPAARLAAAAGLTSISLLAVGMIVSGTWAMFTAGSATSDSSLTALAVAAPTLNTAVSGPAGAVTLSWTATPSAAQRPDLTFVYSVYRSSGGAPVLVNASPTAALSYTDTPPSDGTWTYTVVASVSSFSSAASNAVAGLSDRVAPSTSIACGAGACSAGWYRAAVTITISATDSGSGVKSITYTVDGAGTTIGGATAAFTLGDGAHTITYSALDVAGNVSGTATQLVQVDATPPVISAVAVCDTSGQAPPAAPGWISQGSTYRVLAALSDATSGVASASATVTVAGSGTIASGAALTAQSTTCGGQTYTYASAPLTAPVTLAAGSGTVTIAVTATDVAGNSASTSAGAGVDDTAPTISSFKITNGASHSGQVTANWTASSALSGLAGFVLQVDLAGTTTPAPEYPNPIVLGAGATSDTLTLATGTHYDFYLTAIDNAGNSSTAASQTNKRAP